MLISRTAWLRTALTLIIVAIVTNQTKCHHNLSNTIGSTYIKMHVVLSIVCLTQHVIKITWNGLNANRIVSHSNLSICHIHTGSCYECSYIHIRCTFNSAMCNVQYNFWTRQPAKQIQYKVNRFEIIKLFLFLHMGDKICMQYLMS